MMQVATGVGKLIRADRVNAVANVAQIPKERMDIGHLLS